MSGTVTTAIGFLGLTVVVASFQCKERLKLLLLFLFAHILWGLHFALLGATSAAAINGAAIIRTSFFALRDRWHWSRSPFWLGAFITLFCVVGTLFWEGPKTALIIVAMSVECIALWQKDQRRVRFFSLFPRPCWFTYNLLSGSIPGVITEVIVLTSVITSIVRYDRRKK